MVKKKIELKYKKEHDAHVMYYNLMLNTIKSLNVSSSEIEIIVKINKDKIVTTAQFPMFAEMLKISVQTIRNIFSKLKSQKILLSRDKRYILHSKLQLPINNKMMFLLDISIGEEKQEDINNVTNE